MASATSPPRSKSLQHTKSPFDVAALTRKLEAHQRDLLDFRSPPNKKTVTGTRASYVPRNAAAQFASTSGNFGLDPFQRPALPRCLPPTVVAVADPIPTINPKQMQAALALGMSENEIAYGSTQHRERRWSSVQQRQAHEEQLPSPPALPGQPRRDSASKGYRPGDAAKRNAAHDPFAQQSNIHMGTKLIAVKQGLKTTYVREHEPILMSGVQSIPAFKVIGTTHDGRHGVSAIDDPTIAQDATAAHRPKLAPHDRHNWAQESQCGEDAPHFLQIPHRRRKSSTPHVDSARKALEDHPPQSTAAAETLQPTGRPPINRLRSAGDVHDGKLISEAVKLLKQEEKTKRRQSVMHFFTRH